MEPRRIATFGLVLVLAMQATFVATGGDRGGLYVGVNALSLLAAAAMIVGARRLPARGAFALLGGGLAAQAALRALNVALDLTRLPLWDSALIFAGWALGAWGAFARSAAMRAGLFVAGVGYFAALATTLSGGRLSAILALLAGSVGLLLAAPWIEAEPSGA